MESRSDAGAAGTGKEKEKETPAMSAEEVQLMELYRGTKERRTMKALEAEMSSLTKEIHQLAGHEESDTGLAHPSQWDLAMDLAALRLEKPLQVAVLSRKLGQVRDKERMMVSLKQSQKYVVELGAKAAATGLAVKEGDRVGLEPPSLDLALKLPPHIESAVALMEVEERPDVTFADVGGQKKAVAALREVLETAILHPERPARLGITPPRGVLLYGPPGTGKTLCARALANETRSTFICVIGSQLVQKYVGEGARLVREIFQLARSKKSAILFLDEIDAIGGTRFNDSRGSDSEVQRTMLELIAQMDGFDATTAVHVLMATNRRDSLDPALTRPGRIDRSIKLDIPDAAGRAEVFRVAAARMKLMGPVRWELLGRLAGPASPAEIRAMAADAGLRAIREKRRSAAERHFLAAVAAHQSGQARFSATPSYLTHN